MDCELRDYGLRKELKEAAMKWEIEHPEISEWLPNERIYNAFVAGAEFFLKEYCYKAG